MIICKVKDDLGAWGLHRVIWFLDRGFNSAENRRYLQRGGGHCIVSERLRSDSTEAQAALSRAGRYGEVAGNLRVKEVRVGTDGFVICHNPERARRDQVVWGRIVAHLEARIEGCGAVGPPLARQAPRALRGAVDEVRAQALPTPDQGREAARRQSGHKARGPLRRQVLVAKLR